ncbi:MAG: CarD family transcriptional regulator [Desulfovibrionaceae bacterium]|nr:CarD family transcriptional regulator [Desulfovibrionaceae bacterium]
MYKVDDLVVYPAQGVGKINRIDTKTIGGASCDIYIVGIQSNNITLMVPVKNAGSVGLRQLVDKQTAADILDSLKNNQQAAVTVGQNWNRRFRKYSDKMKSPDLGVVADVLRELLVLGRDKELSYGERRLQEQAMSLVAGEISEVLGTTTEDIRDTLLRIYAPAPAPADEARPKSGRGSRS